MQFFPSLPKINILDKSLKASRKTFRARAVSSPYTFKRPDILDIILFLLPLLALFLWSISLQTISLNDMNDLGLILALSPRIIAALGILVISFTLTLQRSEMRAPLLAFQLICIIIILYATLNLIEEMPRFTPVYRHAGYTDYIMQTGTVAPYVDIYFNWPGFFVLSAFFTNVFGYSTILSYAGWAPVFFNLIYVGPMYVIFTSITANKRLVWLSLLFFQLTNWVGQDYFSPQGLNFFLYLVVIMILLKWFKTPPKLQTQLGKDASLRQKFYAWLKAPDLQPLYIEQWKRRWLLCYLLLVYGLIVFSHPLTPFFTLLSVFALVIFRRCYPLWLPIVMATMTAAWILIVAAPYLSEHVSGIVGTLGDFTANLPKSITAGQMKEYPLYAVIAKLRLYMTLLLWLLALLGGVKRLWQGNRDITFILLATVGLTLIATQSYGGEMLMRIYFFTEPFMCFFAASLFFDNSMIMARKTVHIHATFPWRTVRMIAINSLLLSTFLFTRYGDERVDYISRDEWKAVQYLYHVAPTSAFIVEAWNDAPLYFKYYTKYKIATLAHSFPEAVMHTDADGIAQFFQNENNPNSYILFSQEEQANAYSWSGLPDDALQRLETGLLHTGKFKLIYGNADAHILQFVEKYAYPWKNLRR